MFCKNCGAEISDKSVVCPKCGVPVVDGPYPTQNPVQLAKAPNSISGFVCSLAGLFVPFLGLALSIVGLVLCSKGQEAVRKNPNAYSGTGFLTAGIILGIVGLLWAILLILYGLVFGGAVLSLLDLF